MSGIKDEIYTLLNNIQVRPDCSMIVSRCDAYDFLNNSKPNLINLVERYYEVVVTSGEYTGYSLNIKLSDFYSMLMEPSIQPIAILGGINVKQIQKKNGSENFVDKDSSYKAGEALVDDKNSLEIMGIAVFKDDKLVGELNGIETIAHLLLTDQLNDCTVNVSDPFNENSVITLSINEQKTPQNRVRMVNNSPYIESKIYLNANILSLNNNSDYSDDENLKILGKYVDSYIKSHVESYLYKTSKELNSDIIGFGRKTWIYSLDLNNWSKRNWLDNYKNSIFNVQVYTNVKNSFLILKT